MCYFSKLIQCLTELTLTQAVNGLVIAFLALLLNSAPCLAQTYTVADVGYVSPAGTFSVNTGVTPPTYTAAGGGTGYDYKLSFARTIVSGNVEMRARIVSQSETATGAFAGLMLRESDIGQACAMATIGVTKSGTVYFAYRPQNNNSVTTVTGPALTMPCFVRLIKNGDTVSGYYSQTDSQNMTLLGSVTQTSFMPNLFYEGFVTYSTTANLNTCVFDYVTLSTSFPQQSSNLKLWLRADLGITSSGASAISSWSDQSGNGHDATQSTAGLKPTLVTGVLNSGVLPAVAFSGSQYLNLAANYADLNNGASIFVVLKPSSSSLTGNLVSFANTSNTDAVFAQSIGTQGSLTSYAGTTSSTVTTTTNPLSTSQYKLLEATLVPGATAGTGVGTIYVNGALIQQSSAMQNPANTTRNNCFVGAGAGATNIFSGSIAEILIYDNVSNAQRRMIESYLYGKYAVGVAPTLDAPTLSAPSALVAPGQMVTLSQDQNATVYFTENGSTPTAASQWQGSNPIPLNSSVTIQAIAIAPNFANSPVVSSTFTVDPTTAGVPRNGLNLWLRSDLGVTSSSGISQWNDVSGSNNNATQSVSGNRPTLTANSLNGQPAVTFGSSQYFQIPAGMSDFSAGASIFVLLKPTSVAAGARILDFGNGTASNNLQLQEPSTNGAALYTYNGASSTNVTASSALTLNQFQLLEAIDNNSGTATLFTNGVQQNQSVSMNSLLNTLRSNNYIGQASGGGNNYIGQIAELMLFNRAVTASERAATEAYLINRGQILNVNAPPAPVFSIGTSTLAAPAQVAIEGPAESVYYFTVDGSTPAPTSPTSTPYTGPINIIYTQTLKAIAVNRGVQSAVTTATYTVDSTKYPAPSTTSTPLQLDLQLPNQSIPQDANQH